MTERYIIELTKTIKVPKPDRRSNDWYKAKEIPAGTRFAIWETREETPLPAANVVMKSTRYLVAKIDGKGTSGFVSGYRVTEPSYEEINDDLLPLILKDSVMTDPKTVIEMLHVVDMNEGTEFVLSDLLKLGIITFDDLKKLAAAPRDEDGELVL